MTDPIRVLIVDDDVPTRVGLRTILEADDDIIVVDESADADDACTKAEKLHPHVVLMDVQLGGSDGIRATQRIRSGRDDQDSGPRVIVLTTFELDEYAYRSMQAGASGFLLKRTRAEDLVEAVRTVAAGSALPMPEMARRVIEHFSSAADGHHADELTNRETQVLVLIARGYSNQEIAERLIISHDTVKSHIKHLFSKLGVRDRAQAVIAAYESGIVSPGLVRELDADNGLRLEAPQ